MSKVEFTYAKGGKIVKMATRTAEALRKMGYGDYRTRMLTAAAPEPAPEPLASDAVRQLAAEAGVDLRTVAGTGKDGRVLRTDVEAVIASRG